MKNLMLGLVVALATVTSQAATEAKAVIIASVNGSQNGLSQVAVTSDKRLILTNDDGTTKQGQLSEPAFEEISNMAEGLAEAELSDQRSIVVCAMMPRPELSDLQVAKYNPATGVFGKTQKLVLTAQNCATSHKVFPTQEVPRRQAEKLKATLKVLGLNTVK